MKIKLRFLVLLLAAFFLAAQSFAQNKNKMYKAKSGIIEYKLSGKTNGNETMYFDDHGKKTATYRESTTKMLGMTSTENTLSLRIDSVLYNINLDDKTGVRTVIPFDPSEMTDEEIKEMEELSEKMMDDMGFEKIGEEKILGRNCDIWKGMGTKTWVWESLPLKTEVSIMGPFNSEAVNIELNPRIPADKFKIPEGIVMTNVDLDDYDQGDYGLNDEEADALDSLGSDLGKEIEKGLNDLKSILGVKKKKKK